MPEPNELTDAQFRELLKAIQEGRPLDITQLMWADVEVRDALGFATQSFQFSPRSQLLLDTWVAIETQRRTSATFTQGQQQAAQAVQDAQVARDRATTLWNQEQARAKIENRQADVRFEAGLTDASRKLDLAEQTFAQSKTEFEAQRQQAIADLGFRFTQLGIQAQEAGLDRLLQRELQNANLTFQREELQTQTGLGVAGLLTQRDIAQATLGQREREAQLGAQVSAFQGAIQNPFAFSALQALRDQQRQQEAEQATAQQNLAAQGQFQQAQGQFQQAQATRAGQEAQAQQGVQQSLLQIPGLFGNDQAGNQNIFTQLMQRELQKALAALGPGPVAPTAPQPVSIAPRQLTGFEQELGKVGFALPGGAQPGQQTPAGQFFQGGIPTLGGLGQLTPESQQFLQSILGFTGTSPGSFGQQVAAITPSTMSPQFAGIRPIEEERKRLR